MNKDSIKNKSLVSVLNKIESNIPLSRDDIDQVLNLKQSEEIQSVFQLAGQLREKHFGNRIFLYGFLYFSTFCRNSCNFCLYRKNNMEAPRYRKSKNEIIESSKRLADSGVNLIDLTMGEDPVVFKKDNSGFETLLDIISSVKKVTGLPIMISAGVLPELVLSELLEAGASWYACYQETHNRDLYDRMRAGQDYDIRLNSKKRAKGSGLLIEEGLLTGIGESNADIIDSFEAIKKLESDQIRVMTLVPQKGTPMKDHRPSDYLKELLIIALMRIIFPDRLIPGSLDVGGQAELELKLAAGANVVTSLIPPGLGLAGVAQSSVDIEDGKRTVVGIQKVLGKNDLVAASNEQYQKWINKRRAIKKGL